ncbi:MAG: LAGLIDADG family homing endonuclease [Dehalococcoidales bacterium]|nr:LAGLIDADG family homing endonuclease [Dehalococcoidales bacterium]
MPINVWPAVTYVIDKIPFARIFSPPPSQRKSVEELKEILDSTQPVKPAKTVVTEEEPPRPRETNHPSFIKEEPIEEGEFREEPADLPTKVHLAPRPASISNVTTEETVAYQNREIGKQLLQLERHASQKFTIAGKRCDCLVGGTLIYNNHAPIAIGKIQGTVLTHKGRVQNVTQHMDRLYDGDLREIRVAYSNVPLLITPEHPILGISNAWRNNWKCNYGGLSEENIKWVPASDMTEGSFTAFPRIRRITDMDIITPDLAELLGWYVAEGSKEKDPQNNRIVLSLNKQETDNILRIRALFAKCFGEDTIIRDRETSTQIEYTNKAYIGLFTEFGIGTHNKQIPEWMLYLPEEKQYRFLNGYFHGDGNKRECRSNELQATTVSQQLAYGLRLVLFRLGILHGIHMAKQLDGLIAGRVIIGNGTRYNIRIGGAAAKTLGNKIGFEFKNFNTVNDHTPMNWGDITENYVFLPIKSNEPKEFHGSVYNISVAYDESYLTINGAVHNCGQSRHLLDLESLAEETISMVDNPDIYNRILDFVKDMGPKVTIEALESGQYDVEFAGFVTKARDFRKELLGTLDSKALFPHKEEEKV